ncbi:hypothetical protein TNCV_2526321 [Trichonephila clavipes]|nr:hypothetical protein TNCV_2526321 [Trichonephila clavipes]
MMVHHLAPTTLMMASAPQDHRQKVHGCSQLTSFLLQTVQAAVHEEAFRTPVLQIYTLCDRTAFSSEWVK